jgi:hypothetical protein
MRPVKRAPDPPQNAVCGEARALAVELGKAYREMVAFYREHMDLSAEEAHAKASEGDPEALARRVRHEGDLRQASWITLQRLAAADEALAVDAWQQINLQAREDLANGHRAARVLERVSSEPSDRADFLAVRQALVDEWQPRGGAELLLVDMMAQAATMMEDWLRTQLCRSFRELDLEKLREEKREMPWLPPRIDQVEAVTQAATEYERWNRIFIRALRSLRDLRRYSPAVHVHQGGQVNIGGQQLNVAGQTHGAQEACN